jgi:hypothetical protein
LHRVMRPFCRTASVLSTAFSDRIAITALDAGLETLQCAFRQPMLMQH